VLETTLEMHPSWAISRVELARVHLGMGRRISAVEALRPVEPEWAEFLAAVERQSDESETWLRRWRAPESHAAPYWLAERCMWAGDEEGALAALEEAFDSRQLHLLYVAVEPTFRPLHGNSRFAAVLSAMGLTGSGDAAAPR
jgi:hypothetical protein